MQYYVNYQPNIAEWWMIPPQIRTYKKGGNASIKWMKNVGVHEHIPPEKLGSLSTAIVHKEG